MQDRPDFTMIKTYQEFSQYYWYNPVIEPDNFSDTWLNACQISNRDLIVSYEKRHGFN